VLDPDEDHDRAQRAAPRVERKLGVLLQDRLLKLSQGRGRLDPELGDEHLPRRSVDLKRLRLSTGSVKRPHQRGGKALVERVLVYDRFQLRDELGVAAERKIRLDSQLERGQTRSPEAMDLCL